MISSRTPLDRNASRRVIRTVPMRCRSPILGGRALASVAVAFVVVLLLIAPLSEAKKLGPIGKHVAPFHGTLHIERVIVTTGCGASASFPVAPKFNLSSGNGVVSSKSSVTGCGPPGFPDFGGTVGSAGFDGTPFTWTSATSANVTFNFTFTLVANLTATPMNPFGGPYAWASYEFYERGQFWDLTTDSLASVTSAEGFDTTNSSTSGFVNETIGYTGQFGTYGNFTTGHQYIVQMYFYAEEQTYAPSNSTTSATARLNMATGGNHFKAFFWQIS
jgi:hypothetical protein